MLRIAVELALHEPLYEEFVEKFFQHTLFIAGAMDRVGEHHDEMWDEEDGFFYDVLRFPDGSATRLKVRSIVGLLPLAAVAIFEEDILAKLPKFAHRARLFMGATPSSSPASISRASRGKPVVGCCPSSTRKNYDASSRACSMRPSSSDLMAFGRCPASTSTTHTSSITPGRTIA
jgi:hypothetical protein